MDHEASAHDLLERILLDENKDPTNFPIGLLKSITNDFSDDQKIGSGGFADVYKGQLQSGIVAVKKLKELSGKTEDLEVYEKKFLQEVDSLMKVKHKNIVRFLGYCFDTQGKVWKHKGNNVVAEERQRFFCFEFLPQGSLDKHISDASNGLEWRTRYHIIKGICEGLKYLHRMKIVHADLKPENILLDHNMVPKICDFGLARSFHGEQTRAITQKVFGTPGYMAPEYCNGVITFKSDIYSLGIIITEMLTGQKKDDLSIENVHENWTARFKTSHGGTWLEHVRVCVEIGLACADSDPKKRPTIGQIIDMLAELEHKYGFIETDLPATHLLKHKSIKEGSNSSSNISGPSMDYPQSRPSTQQSEGTVYNCKLYMHQIFHGPDYNQVNIADLGQPQMFGCTNVHDYPIYDSLDPNAKIVARAQGLHTETCLDYDNWFHWSRLVFSDERFEGSSFVAIGDQNKITGEWAIVGGTGVFAFAQGTITICRIQDSGSSNIKEICIHALGITGQATPVETKSFKDNMINVDSKAASNACSPSMASPHSRLLTPQSQATEYIRTWYMHQIITGSDYNQVPIANPEKPEMFGYTNVHDYPIYDSLGPGKKIVARAQGLHSKTSMNNNGSWLHWSKVVFDYERFQGSSFNAIGNQEGEWAIVGGTGEFAFVQGTVTTRRVRESWPSNIKEIRIHAFCYPPTTPVETNNKIFEDGMIIIGSNAVSNASSTMANTNSQSAPVTALSMRKYNRILYMHQIISGPDYNQVNIANPGQPKTFAYTNVHDYPVYDSLDPGEKKSVARVQGLHTKTSMSYDGWFHWSSVVFTDERFQGSSLKTIGNQEGDWAIMGGTGVFTFAQGTVTTRRIQDTGFSNIKKIRIDALCCTPVNGVLP